jgi:hypothetical protein
VEYVWRGRVTSIIGQNVPRSLNGLWVPSHPFASGKTVLKEFAKGLLALGGNNKYAMHKQNNILRFSTLRDNTKIYEFIRCNPHWGGVSSCETAHGLVSVLTTKFLDRLIQRQGSCILYTHLGKKLASDNFFSKETRKTFKNLASYFMNGKILITTTRRLLDYQKMLKNIYFSIHNTTDKLVFVCSYKGANSDLEGLSFNIMTNKHFELFINGRTTPLIWRRPHNEIKVASIGWNRREFPKISEILL